jgi:hypothetical protein
LCYKKTAYGNLPTETSRVSFLSSVYFKQNTAFKSPRETFWTSVHQTYGLAEEISIWKYNSLCKYYNSKYEGGLKLAALLYLFIMKKLVPVCKRMLSIYSAYAENVILKTGTAYNCVVSILCQLPQIPHITRLYF